MFYQSAKIKKDYYKLLGISRDANKNEIKQAYRRLVISSHPDKTGEYCNHNHNGNGDGNIYDINEAYSVLRDTDKKKKYDNDIYFDYDIYIANSHEIIILVTKLMKGLKEVITKYPCKKKEEEDKKEEGKMVECLDIKLKIDISLEDLYKKKIKKLTITRRRDGKNEKKILFVSLLNYEMKYIFLKQGDEDSDGNIGDVIVNLNIKEHDVFVLDTIIDKYDLWMEMDISLFDYYYGKTINFNTLDSKNFSFRMDKFNPRNMVHLLKDMGIPYYNENKDEEAFGDLYISFRVKLNELDDNILEKEDVKTVLEKFLS
jgi:DnaJ-class molecular chaperone